MCNPRETAGVLREHAYAVRLLDGAVRSYAQEHGRVHRRDRQRQANAAEQPKPTQVVEAPALAILDVDGDPEAHEARQQRTRDGQAHNLLAARLRPALFAARGEQCFANLRRLGLLSASGLSSFFTLGTYTANLLVDAPYRLPMRRMTPGFDGSGIYVFGHLVLNLALPATLSAAVRDVAVGAGQGGPGPGRSSRHLSGGVRSRDVGRTHRGAGGARQDDSRHTGRNRRRAAGARGAARGDAAAVGRRAREEEGRDDRRRRGNGDGGPSARHCRVEDL